MAKFKYAAVTPDGQQTVGVVKGSSVDGVTESLINTLSELPHLTVMSRSSVLRYAGRDIDPQTAGRDLKVQAVLTGRVVQRGDGLSISVELVDVKNNSHIWGEEYSRKLAQTTHSPGER